jgi:hypothetical protein
MPFLQLVPLLLTYPICKAWARYLPNISLFGFSLNPGPFTIKEHVIITIMASVGGSSAYAVSCKFRKLTRGNCLPHLQTDIVAVQKVFYNQHPSFACTFTCRLP